MNYFLQMPKEKYRYLLIIWLLSSLLLGQLNKVDLVAPLYLGLLFIEYRRIVDAGKSKLNMLAVLAFPLNLIYLVYLCFPDSKRKAIDK